MKRLIFKFFADRSLFVRKIAKIRICGFGSPRFFSSKLPEKTKR